MSSRPQNPREGRLKNFFVENGNPWPSWFFASTDNSVQKPCQLSTMYCATWLVDFWPIAILVKYISIWLLCFYVFRLRTAQIRALNPLLVYFPFCHLENNKINERIWQRPQWLFPGRFGALTRRPGDLMKNLEIPRKTGRVGRYDPYDQALNLLYFP